MPNQYINQVIYGDETLVDLTEDTVVPGNMLVGTTAHDASGAPITGTLGTMTGATAQSNGTDGLVPAPTSSDINKFLKGDGTWDYIAANNIALDNPVFTGSISLGRESNTTVGAGSYAIGENVTASEENAGASGKNTRAIGKASHAEGYDTQAGELKEIQLTNTLEFNNATAEALSNINIQLANPGAVMEGYVIDFSATLQSSSFIEDGNAFVEVILVINNQQINTGTHTCSYTSEGTGTLSFKIESYGGTEGYLTNVILNLDGITANVSVGQIQISRPATITTDYSHAEGEGSEAFGEASHAEGEYTTATKKATHVVGKWNAKDYTNSEYGVYAEIVGNGTDVLHRTNARALDWNGNEYLKGTLYIKGTYDDASGGKEVSTREYVDKIADDIKTTGPYKSLNYPATTMNIYNAVATPPIKQLKITINPIQNGSGDPAPDNIRTFEGWSAETITITNGKESTAENYVEEEYTIAFPLEANTLLYGGLLILNQDGTGLLEDSYYYGTLGTISEINTISLDNSTGKYVEYTFARNFINSATQVVVTFEAVKGVSYVNRGQAWTGYVSPTLSESQDVIRIFVPSDITVAEVNQALEGTHFIAKYATTITTSLSDKGPISLLEGTNKIICSCGEVTAIIYPTSLSGLMSASDKHKLDGILPETLATKVYVNEADTLKADKVIGATNGNFAALDTNGNLIDSGHKHTDYLAISDFVDTTYTFANGTNGFTVTPSGGSTQTVTVTPSIAVATQAANGLMSSADKTKLDTINNDTMYKTISTPAQVMTFDDGADDLPVEEMTIGIEPVQDLHGYENPWPAGGGKNLINLEDYKTYGKWYYNLVSVGTFKTDQSYRGFNLTNIITPGQQYTLSFNFPSTGFPPYCSLCSSDGTTSTRLIAFTNDSNIINNSYSFIPEENITYYIRSGNFSNETAFNNSVKNVVSAQLELGSTATSYAPYSNICPISGWTGVNVTRTGKNLYDERKATFNYSINDAGAITETPGFKYSDLIRVKETEQYTISITTMYSTGTMTRIHGYDQYGNWIEQIDTIQTTSITTTNKTITIPSGVKGIRISTRDSITSIQIESGSTATTYESYLGQTYSITFPSEAGTVYGGTLTVNKDGTGILTVENGFGYLSDQAWTYTSSQLRFYVKLSNAYFASSDIADSYLKCSHYNVSAYSDTTAMRADQVIAGSTDGYLSVRDTNYSTVSDFTTALQGANFIYKLTTPRIYTLTVPQVKTLLGVNNIWSDTGNINSITYPYSTQNTLTTEERYKLSIIEEGAQVNPPVIDPYETINTPAPLIHLTDAAEAPVKEMEIEINPIQYFNGYDHSWAGGVGKNKLPIYTYKTQYPSDIIAGFHTYSSGGIIISGTSLADFDAWLKEGGYFLVGEREEIAATFHYSGNYIVSGSSINPPATIQFYNIDTGEIDASGNGQFILDGDYNIKIHCENNTKYNINIKPMLRLASIIDDTFEPYKNICPISGWDTINMYDTKFNCYPEEWISDGYGINDQGVIAAVANGSSLRTDFFPIKANTTYYYNFPALTGSSKSNIFWYDINKRFIRVDKGMTSFQVTSPSNAAYAKMATSAAYNNASGVYNNDICLNVYNETRNGEYEAYYGHEYEISLPQTVYGGKLTVYGDGSGEVSINKKFYHLTADDNIILTQQQISGFNKFTFAPSSGNVKYDSTKYLACDKLSKVTSANPGIGIFGQGANNIAFLSDLSTVEAFKEWLTEIGGLDIVYELETPITYQLTSPQIQTLLSENNIWASSGNINKIIYVKDSNGLISGADKAIIDKLVSNSPQNKYWKDDGTWDSPIAILEYGVSTWNEFIDAYNKNKDIYCKISSGDGYRIGHFDYYYYGSYDVGPYAQFNYYRSPESSSSADEVYKYRLYYNTNTWDTVVKETSAATMTGCSASAAGTGGLVPAPAAGNQDKFLSGDGTWKSGGMPMVVLSYGNSTWDSFIDAYNNNVIVYCRASSNANPASGNQTRMAFMAYVNSANPTNVEFQYYRSVNGHSASQMCDQVFIYKLDKTSGWSVTTREAGLKQISISSGDAASVSYSSNVITLKSGLPAVTTSDNDKLLKVVSGAWTASTISIPTKVSDLTNDSGFTSNAGTITGITMNGASKGTSGVVNLGTVLTSHQSISHLAPKASPVFTTQITIGSTTLTEADLQSLLALKDIVSASGVSF